MEIKRYKLGPVDWWILIGLGVSLVFGFYHLTIPRWSGNNNYSPLVLNEQAPSFTVDETNAYAPEVREIFDGRFWPSDFFIWEYKDYPSPFKSDLIPALIMGGLSKMTGSVSQGFILTDFIWPPIVFLSLNYFIYLLTKKPYWAPVGTLLIMSFYQYMSYLPYLPSIFKAIFNSLSIGTYSHFIRSYHPQVTFPFFIVFLILLWQMASNYEVKKSKKWILLGVSLGSLFYTYIYFWTLAVAWILMMIMWALWIKNKLLLKRLCLSLGLSLILAGPVLWELWQFQQLNISQSFSLSYKFLPPLTTKPLVLLLIMFGLSRLCLRDKFQSVFWQSFFLSCLGAIIGVHWLNLSIDDPVGHWLDRIIYPVSILFIYYLVTNQLKKNHNVLGVIFSILLLAYLARVHWVYFQKNANTFQIEPTRIEVFNWLNENTPKDSVVLTAGLTDNIYLTIHTHNNVFIPFSYLSLAPQDEALDRLLILYKAAFIPANRIKSMFSVTKENYQLRLIKRLNFDNCGRYYLYYRRFVGADFYNCSVPKEQLGLILDEYQKIDGDLETWQGKYRMDYWLWGPNEKRWAKINPGDLGWQLMWQNQDYQVFKLF